MEKQKCRCESAKKWLPDWPITGFMECETLCNTCRRFVGDSLLHEWYCAGWIQAGA